MKANVCKKKKLEKGILLGVSPSFITMLPTRVNPGLSSGCTLFNTKFGNSLSNSFGHSTHFFNLLNELRNAED